MLQRVSSAVIVCLLAGACADASDDSTFGMFQAEQERFNGVWIVAFESSTFIEGISEAPATRPDYEQTAWLNYDPSQIDPNGDYFGYDAELGCYRFNAFYIDFEGSKTTSFAGSGHLGLWGSEIEVERVIEARPIANPNCQTFSGN